MLGELAMAIQETIDDCQRIDAFVIRPRPPQRLGAEGAGAGAADGITGAHGSEATPGSLDMRLQLLNGASGNLSPPTGMRLLPIKEGYLLRQWRGEWCRRYFCLFANGVLCWYGNKEDLYIANTVQHEAELGASGAGGARIAPEFSVR